MDTPKKNEMTTTEDLIKRIQSNNKARGLDVRCPVCGAGVGKFCLKAGVTAHRSADDITAHAERIALSR